MLRGYIVPLVPTHYTNIKPALQSSLWSISTQITTGPIELKFNAASWWCFNINCQRAAALCKYYTIMKSQHSETLILCFSHIYIFIAWSRLNAYNVKLEPILHFCNFTFSLNMHFIFLVLTIKIYLISCSAVLFSQFLIPHNRPPSLLSVANSSDWKCIPSGWCTVAGDSCVHYMTSSWSNAYESISPSPLSKELVHARPV
jgi:hypothetical protein